MRVLRLAVLLAGAMAAHWFWSMYLSVCETGPQLLLLLTLAVSAIAGPIAGQVFGFLWGLFLDFFSGHVFGANALTLTVLAYLIGRLRKQMDVSAPLSQAVLGAVLAPLHQLALGFIGLGFEHSFLWAGWKALLAAPVYAMLLAPAAFVVAQKSFGDSRP